MDFLEAIKIILNDWKGKMRRTEENADNLKRGECHFGIVTLKYLQTKRQDNRK